MKDHVRTGEGAAQRRLDRRQRFFASSGVGIEWFDFTLFAFLTPTLAPLFFPNASPAVAMISIFAVFGVGYLGRPIGGLVIGRIGDTRGRRAALRLATLLMLVPLLGITILPTYSEIGIWAPLILTLLRLMQGFSVGGEFSGALAMLSETGHPSQRGRSVAAALSTASGGILLASLTAAAASLVFGQESLAHGTWRIPFAVAFVLCIGAYLLQSRMSETSVLATTVEQSTVDSGLAVGAADSSTTDAGPSPLRLLFAHHRRHLLKMFVLALWSAVTFYTVMMWLPSFLATRGSLDQQSALFVSSIMSSLYIVAVFPAAMAGDRFGRRRVMLITAGIYVVVAFPLFTVLDAATIPVCMVAAGVLVLLQVCVDGNATTAITELVPAEVRYTGVAIAYNIAMIVGGFTPMAATALNAITGSDIAAAGILVAMAIAVVPVVVSLRSQESSRVSR